MRMTAKQRDGGRLNVDFAKDVQKALSPERLKSVPEAGIEILRAAAAREVAAKAKHATGALQSSITSRSYAGVMSAGAYVAWEERKVTRSSSKKRNTATYVDDKGVTRYQGSKRRVRKNRRTHFAYTDGRGRGRKVDTVADYGGILEYSESRQLRHIEPAFETSMDAAVDAMERALNNLLASAGL